MPLNPGDYVIGRYRVEGRPGGATYQALDALTGRACIVLEARLAAPATDMGVHSTLAPQCTRPVVADDEVREQMKLRLGLVHPHLAKVIDAFCVGDTCYLVAEQVTGRSLADLLQERHGRPFAAQLALGWLDPVMDALAACHEAGVVHQEVQPAHLVLVPGGQVLLVGLGLGHPAASPYLAPELSDAGQPTAASDVYSLGATLYTLLTGREPVPAAERLRGATLPGPRELAPDPSAEIEAIVLRAMALRPADRFQGMPELRLACAAELAPAAAEPLWGGGLQPVLAASHAPLVLYDDFDADTNGWDTDEAEDELSITKQSIANGKYRWQAKALEGFSWWCCPDVPPARDLFVTVEARQVHGPWTTEHGIAFRADGDDHYTFSIRNDQQFTAYVEHAGATRTLLAWRPSPAIEPGAANRLSVAAQGAHFTLLINDQIVATFDDDTLAEGRVGLLVGLDKAGDEAAIEFDKFELRA